MARAEWREEKRANLGKLPAFLWLEPLAKMETKLRRGDVVGLGHTKVMAGLRCQSLGVWCQPPEGPPIMKGLEEKETTRIAEG